MVPKTMPLWCEFHCWSTDSISIKYICSKGHNFTYIRNILATILNKRTSGPVNTHLILGIYSNTFIYVLVYVPRTGTEHTKGRHILFKTKCLVTLPYY